MKYISFLMVASLLAAPLHAQEAAEVGRGWTDDWEGTMAFSLSPRVGEPLPLDSSEDIVDESEGELSFVVRRPRTIGSLQLQLKGGVTSSPHLFDDDDPESSLYGELTLGDTYLTIGELVLREGGDPSAIRDAVRPYFRYRLTNVYGDFLQDWSRRDHTVTTGVRYRDIRTIMCHARMPAAAEVGACTNRPGVYVEARAEVNQTWSTNIGYRRLYPSLRVDVYSRPFAGGLRVFGWAQGELSFFHDERTPDDEELRRDFRLRLTGGLDLSEWARRLGPRLDLVLAGQYQRRWSNNAGKEHDRGYFIPSLTLTTGF